MPRYARSYAPDTVHHLIGRFVNGEFRLTTDEARKAYLARLPRILARLDWRFLAYGLLGNHVHDVGEAGADGPWRLVQPLHTGFAQWLNRAQGRSGPLFEERYHDVIFDPGTIAVLLAYVHNNPVRAGVVADPFDSTWTSHRAYLGEAPAPPWLDVARGLSLCGFDSSSSGRLAFHDFVRARAGLPRDPSLTEGNIRDERTLVRRFTGAPVELASPEVETGTFQRKLTIGARGDVQLRPSWTGPIRTVADEVSRWSGVSIARLRERTKTRDASRARRLLLRLWTGHLGRQLGEAALFVGISTGAASNLMSRCNEMADIDKEAILLAMRCWDVATGLEPAEKANSDAGK